MGTAIIPVLMPTSTSTATAADLAPPDPTEGSAVANAAAAADKAAAKAKAEKDEPTYPVTICGKTAEWTPEGKEYLKKAVPFCDCLHTIVDRLIRRVPFSKAELSERFGLSSRLYNSAEICAKGEFASLEETKVLALQTAMAKYDKTLEGYMRGHLYGASPERQLGSIARIGKWRKRVAKHLANQDKPRYFPGHDVFDRQHEMGRDEFKKKFHEARHSRITSVGEWGEAPCCNSEIQISFKEYVYEQSTRTIVRQGRPLQVDVSTGFLTGYRFEIKHAGVPLCTVRLGLKEGSVLHERLLQNGVPYEYDITLRAPTEDELREGKFGFGPEFIGPIGVPVKHKIREGYYIPLTVSLLRDKKKGSRWQLRCSWMQPGVEPYAVGDTFMALDTNRDSIAYVLFCLRGGRLVELFRNEVRFDEDTGNGKGREQVVHGALNQMFEMARAHGACMVAERLAFEGGKLGFSALGSMLHGIPYAFIRDALVRKGLMMGVPVRFVNPAGTSILGGLFTGMNRDMAAALVIGLLGSDRGIKHLEAMCRDLMAKMATEGIPYKVEVKNKFSEVVTVRVGNGARRQSVEEARDRRGTTSAYRLSRLLSEVIRRRSGMHHRNRKVGRRLPSEVYLDAVSSAPTAGPGTGITPAKSYA